MAPVKTALIITQPSNTTFPPAVVEQKSTPTATQKVDFEKLTATQKVAFEKLLSQGNATLKAGDCCATVNAVCCPPDNVCTQSGYVCNTFCC